MSYGLPCPDDTPQPAEVFDLTAQYDAVLGTFATSVMALVAQSQTESSGLIASALDRLTAAVNTQLAKLNTTLQGVLTVLLTQVTSQLSIVNSSLMSTITQMAQESGTSTEEILYAPAQQPTVSQLFPPGTSPVAPPGTRPVTPLFPQASSPAVTVPTAPPPSPFPLAPLEPTAPPFPTLPTVPVNVPVLSSVSIDGSTSAVQQVCQQLQSQGPISVNGSLYQPTFTVYQSSGGVTVGPNGLPTFSVAYDRQPDGSVVVQVGPVAVQVALPPHPANPQAPACNLNMG